MIRTYGSVYLGMVKHNFKDKGVIKAIKKRI